MTLVLYCISVVTTLPCSTLILIPWQLVLDDTLEDVLNFSFYNCYSFFHVLNNTQFKHITSTYYHSSYLVFEFTFNVTYIHWVIDI